MEIVNMKLSVSAIEELKLGTSTQKCEAVNRSLSISLPKGNDFPRNVHGRLHSTIHRPNNGIAVSGAKEKLEQVGVQMSDRSAHVLQQMQREVEYQKEHANDQNTMT